MSSTAGSFNEALGDVNDGLVSTGNTFADEIDDITDEFYSTANSIGDAMSATAGSFNGALGDINNGLASTGDTFATAIGKINAGLSSTGDTFATEIGKITGKLNSTVNTFDGIVIDIGTIFEGSVNSLSGSLGSVGGMFSSAGSGAKYAKDNLYSLTSTAGSLVTTLKQGGLLGAISSANSSLTGFGELFTKTGGIKDIVDNAFGNLAAYLGPESTFVSVFKKEGDLMAGLGNLTSALASLAGYEVNLNPDINVNPLVNIDPIVVKPTVTVTPVENTTFWNDLLTALNIPTENEVGSLTTAIGTIIGADNTTGLGALGVALGGAVTTINNALAGLNDGTLESLNVVELRYPAGWDTYFASLNSILQQLSATIGAFATQNLIGLESSYIGRMTDVA
jgi:hypothetical protein